MFPLRDHFDVAHLLGHRAFEHLAKAISVYCWVHEHDLNDTSKHHWQECFEYGWLLTARRREELEACVGAVILFQASMEKIPYFVPTIGGRLKATTKMEFAPSWNDLLDQISDVQDRVSAKAAFTEYETTFYKAMRDPIVHGRQALDITCVNSIRTANVYAGMKAGWRAYDLLLVEAYKANGQSHQPSWSEICEIHGIPDVLDAALYPDLGALSNEYAARNLEGIRAAEQ
jgi:hypothetical protein